MKLEDALLCCVYHADRASAGGAAKVCRDLVAGGVDMVRLVHPATEGVLQAAVETCREFDALILVENDAAASVRCGGSGVHLSDPSISVSLARAMAGDGAVVGISATSLDEARVQLDLGPDYLMYEAGVEAAGDLFVLRDVASIPMYAGGITSLEEAGQVVQKGILRLCLDLRNEISGSLTEKTAAYARLLGRCI